MKTATPIRRMLRENTGSILTDSGGIYGYKYNAPLPKEAIRAVTFDGKVDFHLVSLAHWLTVNTEYDAARTRSLWRFANSPKWIDAPWEDCLAAWADRHKLEIREYGYTYNWDTSLDQHFAAWEFDDPETGETFAIIRSHNGCDARWGFSRPRIFRALGDNDGLETDTRLEYYCPECEEECEPTEDSLNEDGCICERCGHQAYVDCLGLY